MSISEYYLRNWPAPVCPLNTLQSVAPHTRGALAKCLPRNSGTGRGMRLKTTAQSRSGVQLIPRSVFQQKGTGYLRASIVVLFPFRRPPPSALALRLCQQLSASSGIVPARLGQPPAPPVPPQFLIVFQAVDGFFLLFPPPSCSHTVYNLLESINFSLWSVQSPSPAQNRQGGRQDFRLASSSCID